MAGRVCGEAESEWPDDPDLNTAIYPVGRDTQFRVLCLPRLGRMPFSTPPENWDFFRAGEISWQKFLQGLDFFVYYPGARHVDLPLTALRWAMAHGVIAILPPELEPAVGEGPLYLSPDRVLRETHRLHSDPVAYEELASQAKAHMRQKWRPDILTARLERLVGPAPAAPRPRRARSRRILFMSSNGVGIGHLTRLLAIARRMPPDIEPVFATMSQAAGIVQQFGLSVEHISGRNRSNQGDWDGWLRSTIETLLEFHDTRCIVFDGNRPPKGLLDAMASRAERPIVWIRRGMWRRIHATEPSLERRKHFDLTIEPGDIAGEFDLGPTAQFSKECRGVEPIRLLDENELLPREIAAQHLGLDPTRPAMLVHLGNGDKVDNYARTEEIDLETERHPELSGRNPGMGHNTDRSWSVAKCTKAPRVSGVSILSRL